MHRRKKHDSLGVWVVTIAALALVLWAGLQPERPRVHRQAGPTFEERIKAERWEAFKKAHQGNCPQIGEELRQDGADVVCIGF